MLAGGKGEVAGLGAAGRRAGSRVPRDVRGTRTSSGVLTEWDPVPAAPAASPSPCSLPEGCA